MSLIPQTAYVLYTTREIMERLHAAHGGYTELGGDSLILHCCDASVAQHVAELTSTVLFEILDSFIIFYEG